MILLGITGPIGHGKSTLADALNALVPKTAHLETGVIVSEVANAMHAVLTDIPDPHDLDSLNAWVRHLPPILEKTVHQTCTFEQVCIQADDLYEQPIMFQKLALHLENLGRQPTLLHQAITAENKEVYRPFLQWLGGYLVVKLDPGIWWHEMIRRVRNKQQDGCELCIVGALRYPKDAEIFRQAGGIIVKIYRPDHLQNDLQDPTERERENIRPDTTILSTGTVEDLAHITPAFLADLKNGTLKPEYRTT